MSNLNMCQQAGLLYDFEPYRVAQYMMIAVSTTAILESCFVIYISHSKALFHPNAKILVYTLLVLCILHAIFVDIVQIMGVVRRFLYDDDCQLLYKVGFCIYFRFSYFVCMAGMCFVQAFMVVERCLATLQSSRYERKSWSLGVAFAVTSMLLSICFNAFMHRNENFDEEQLNCGAPSRTFDLVSAMFFLAAVDAVAIISFLALHFCNRRLRALRFRRNKVFELSSTYQISENIRVTLLLSPILIVHFIIFFCYFIGMIIIQLNIDNISYTDFRTIMIYLYVVPYYTLAAPVILHWVILHENRRRASQARRVLDQNNVDEHRAAYFSSLHSQWDEAFRTKFKS